MELFALGLAVAGFVGGILVGIGLLKGQIGAIKDHVGAIPNLSTSVGALQSSSQAQDKQIERIVDKLYGEGAEKGLEAKIEGEFRKLDSRIDERMASIEKHNVKIDTILETQIKLSEKIQETSEKTQETLTQLQSTVDSIDGKLKVAVQDELLAHLSTFGDDEGEASE